MDARQVRQVMILITDVEFDDLHDLPKDGAMIYSAMRLGDEGWADDTLRELSWVQLRRAVERELGLGVKLVEVTH